MAHRSRSTSQLQRELRKRTPFESAAQETYLAIQRTAALLASDFNALFRRHGLSEPAYNLLRILRGSLLADDEPGYRTCSEIGRHMVTPVPDVTRLVDRLEERGLVARKRADEDRRVVRVSITRAGLDLLARLDEPLMELHRTQLAHVPEEDLERVIALLDRIRAGHVARDDR